MDGWVCSALVCSQSSTTDRIYFFQLHFLRLGCLSSRSSHSPVRGCARNLILYLYHINSRNDVPYPSREKKNDHQPDQSRRPACRGSVSCGWMKKSTRMYKTIFVMVRRNNWSNLIEIMDLWTELNVLWLLDQFRWILPHYKSQECDLGLLNRMKSRKASASEWELIYFYFSKDGGNWRL